MPSKTKPGEFQAAFAQPISEEARAQELFNKQKAYFASDATKSYEWRIDQLDRLIRMLKDNYKRFSNASCKDFKTATQENVFEVSASIASAEFTKSQLKEWMKPVEAPIPKFLAASGHKGVVYQEPYGVTLIICPFNGPLLLSLRPAVVLYRPATLHVEALRSSAGDGRVALGIDTKVFRARSPECRRWWQGSSHKTPEAFPLISYSSPGAWVWER